MQVFRKVLLKIEGILKLVVYFKQAVKQFLVDSYLLLEDQIKNWCFLTVVITHLIVIYIRIMSRIK